jgi:phage terminase small subunit
MALLATSLAQGLFLSAFTVVLGSLLAWIVGKRVTEVWDERRRRRESDLTALAMFYQAYGEFFATWKLWNAHKRFGREPAGGLARLQSPDDVQWTLLERAAGVEGGFEALLVKLVSERNLDETDRTMLGCFREAYQMLREAIRKNTKLGWQASAADQGTEQRSASTVEPATGAEQYRAFKELAEYVAFRLQERPHKGRLAVPPKPVGLPDVSIEALLDITDRDRFHDDWWTTAANTLDPDRPGRITHPQQEPAPFWESSTR